MFIGALNALSDGFAEHPEIIRRGLRYLAEQDFSSRPDGRCELRGSDCFLTLQRYRTKPVACCYPEAHRKYVDIQFVVEGEEYLGWCPLSPDLEVHAPYDAAKDIIFYERLVPDSNIILAAGSYAILYPEDVHRPQVAMDDQPMPVTKVVMKIATELL